LEVYKACDKIKLNIKFNLINLSIQNLFMKNFQSLKSPDDLKILGDETRQRILRILMSQPATLSQIGERLNSYPAKIRHHLKRLEEAGFVELTSTKVVRGFVEKYYQASAKAYHVNFLIAPDHPKENVILATGSHDLALELLASSLHQDKKTPDFQAIPIGSLDGLIAVRQGLGHIAGCHLFDPITKEYNLPYVRALFPDQKIRLITLIYRQQGLIVASGNPKGIHSLVDLADGKVRFINRQSGSGTRIWIDQRLTTLGLDCDRILGYEREVHTHNRVANEILARRADVGLGLQAVAIQSGLDFIPLFTERYDLVIPEDQFHNPKLQPALEVMHSKKFRLAVESLGGYDTHNLGVEVSV
jgi:molybdate-binding protein/DNA-binding HxlR family transcriptional regulator